MKRVLISTLILALLSSSLLAFAQDDAQTRDLGSKGVQRIIKEVHHELVLLPYYGVFDNLAYKVDPDGTVTLLGQVTRPTLKSDAEADRKAH